jgi:glycosyltransferase involved in cell wall biosynthesis
MKIVHICLEQPYIDGWTYQENILPECQARRDNDVVVIGSRNAFPYYLKMKVDYKDKIMPYLVGKVKIIRIERKFSIFNRLDYYPELLKTLNTELPDLIFHHGGQSASLLISKKYVKNHKKTKLVIDFHAEYYNSATNIISKIILHKIIWRKIIKSCLPYINSIYCISPSVKKMCKELYLIPEDKIKYMFLGTNIPKQLVEQRETIRKQIRSNLGLSENDFLLITGGKLNQDKKLDIIINALKYVNDESIHLIVFGRDDPGEAGFAEKIVNGLAYVHMVGWCDAEMISRYYLSADLAIFPGGQSVLWQQAIETGLPAIFRYWQGNEYLNNGNAIFLYSDNYEELGQWICYLSKKNNYKLFDEMRNKAMELARNELSYDSEANRIIEDNFKNI